MPAYKLIKKIEKRIDSGKWKVWRIQTRITEKVEEWIRTDTLEKIKIKVPKLEIKILAEYKPLLGYDAKEIAGLYEFYDEVVIPEEIKAELQLLLERLKETITQLNRPYKNISIEAVNRIEHEVGVLYDIVKFDSIYKVTRRGISYFRGFIIAVYLKKALPKIVIEEHNGEKIVIVPEIIEELQKQLVKEIGDLKIIREREDVAMLESERRIEGGVGLKVEPSEMLEILQEFANKYSNIIEKIEIYRKEGRTEVLWEVIKPESKEEEKPKEEEKKEEKAEEDSRGNGLSIEEIEELVQKNVQDESLRQRIVEVLKPYEGKIKSINFEGLQYRRKYVTVEFIDGTMDNIFI